MQSKDAKQKRGAAKFEEMITALYEFDHWLDKQRQIRVFGQQGEIGVSPLAKVQAISAVYFPGFREKLNDVHQKTNQYELWMSEAAKKRVQGQTQGIGDGIAEVYRPYRESFNALLAQMRDYAAQEFQ